MMFNLAETLLAQVVNKSPGVTDTGKTGPTSRMHSVTFSYNKESRDYVRVHAKRFVSHYRR